MINALNEFVYLITNPKENNKEKLLKEKLKELNNNLIKEEINKFWEGNNKRDILFGDKKEFLDLFNGIKINELIKEVVEVINKNSKTQIPGTDNWYITDNTIKWDVDDKIKQIILINYFQENPHFFDKLDDIIDKISSFFKEVKITYGIHISSKPFRAYFNPENKRIYFGTTFMQDYTFYLLKKQDINYIKSEYPMFKKPLEDFKEHKEINLLQTIIHEITHYYIKLKYPDYKKPLQDILNYIYAQEYFVKQESDLHAFNDTGEIIIKSINRYFNDIKNKFQNYSKYKIEEFETKTQFYKNLKIENYKIKEDKLIITNKELAKLSLTEEDKKFMIQIMKEEKLKEEDKEFIIQLPYNIILVLTNWFYYHRIISEPPALLSEFILLLNYYKNLEFNELLDKLEEHVKFIQLERLRIETKMTQEQKREKGRQITQTEIRNKKIGSLFLKLSKVHDSEYQMYQILNYNIIKELEKTKELELNEEFIIKNYTLISIEAVQGIKNEFNKLWRTYSSTINKLKVGLF